MKLKNQFLSLSALLAMGMATSAWGALCTGSVTNWDEDTRELESDGQGGYYINMHSPSSTACHAVRTTVKIPDGVKTFKVYDDGGVNGNFTSPGCGTWHCSYNIVIEAPEGYNIRVTGSLKSRPNTDGSTAGDFAYLLIQDKAANTLLKEYSGVESNVLAWVDHLANIRFYAADYQGTNQEGLDLTVHLLKKSETKSTTAIDVYDHGDASVYNVAKIKDGTYQGDDAVSITNAIPVDAIEYDRVFTAGTAGTIVLPFQLPAGATTNAKFYYLKQVVQVQGECKWKATMKWIGDGVVPSANTPYAVIVPSGSELKFNLNGGEASFQTATIAEQLDASKNWIFKGTYQYKTWGADDAELGLAYAIASENGVGYKAGDFVKIGEGASAAPMRAYISKANSGVTLQSLGRPLAMGEVSSIESLPESIDVEFVDEDEKPMAIGRLNTVTGAIKINRWVDLKGRSVNHKPTTKGAFFNKKGIAK